jgi:hypothetical protein
MLSIFNNNFFAFNTHTHIVTITNTHTHSLCTLKRKKKLNKSLKHKIYYNKKKQYYLSLVYIFYDSKILKKRD